MGWSAAALWSALLGAALLGAVLLQVSSRFDRCCSELCVAAGGSPELCAQLVGVCACCQSQCWLRWSEPCSWQRQQFGRAACEPAAAAPVAAPVAAPAVAPAAPETELSVLAEPGCWLQESEIMFTELTCTEPSLARVP